MTDKVDNAQQDLVDNEVSGAPGNHFPTHEPAYDQAQPGLSEHAGGSKASEGGSYVPGHDGGREGLADSVGPHSNAKSGGLGQTNFAAGGAQGQGSSGLGNPPEDYQTPKEHAAQQRQQGDSAGSGTGGKLPSRSPLEEKPQADSTLGFGAKSDGQTPVLHSGAVPNDPASSGSHGGGQNSGFEGRSQQELNQSGRQGGSNSQPSSDTKGSSTAVGAGAAGAAGAAAGGSSAAAAHTPQSDSELISKYSTKQEVPILSSHALDDDQTAAGAAPQQQGSAAASSPAASPSSARATQSSDKEPLPTSKNAGLEQSDSMPDLRPQSAFFKQSQEGVIDTDKGAAGKASGSDKKAGKACCSVM